jgi:hypothetical protein
MQGKLEEYWNYFNQHSSQNGGSGFTQDFMDLIIRMLAFQPNERIKL